MSGNAQHQSRIKELIARGREQGYLTYAEVNDHLPEDISDPDQVEDIIQMINDMGISVYETAPDAEQLLMKSPLPKPQQRWRLSRPNNTAPPTRFVCTCVKWVRWSCSLAKAK